MSEFIKSTQEIAVMHVNENHETPRLTENIITENKLVYQNLHNAMNFDSQNS